MGVKLLAMQRNNNQACIIHAGVQNLELRDHQTDSAPGRISCNAGLVYVIQIR